MGRQELEAAVAAATVEWEAADEAVAESSAKGHTIESYNREHQPLLARRFELSNALGMLELELFKVRGW